MPTLIISIFIVCFVSFCSSAGHAASADEVVKKAAGLSGAQRKAFLEEGAKKERELVFYTSLSLTDYPKIMPHFEKSYPFIKTNGPSSIGPNLNSIIDQYNQTFGVHKTK